MQRLKDSHLSFTAAQSLSHLNVKHYSRRYLDFLCGQLQVLVQNNVVCFGTVASFLEGAMSEMCCGSGLEKAG